VLKARGLRLKKGLGYLGRLAKNGAFKGVWKGEVLERKGLNLGNGLLRKVLGTIFKGPLKGFPFRGNFILWIGSGIFSGKKKRGGRILGIIIPGPG